VTQHATISGGHEAWVGSVKPTTPHNEAVKLKVAHLANYAFVRRSSPVPFGDACTDGALRFWVAEDAAGTFDLVARRTASAPDWGDLKWDNMPGVTGASMPGVTLVNPRKGDLVEFDVQAHLNTIANGYGQVKNYGWRIESSNATPLWLQGQGASKPPQLYAEWTRKPAKPTDLSPSGTTSLAKPIVTAHADDTTAEEDVAQVRWQIDTPATGVSPDGTSPDWDSGLQTAVALELDLSTTTSPTFAGLVLGAATYHRCLWVNASGAPSAWSDWYPITRKAKVTHTVANPAAGVVHDLTPILMATASAAIDTWRIRVVDPADPSNVLASSRVKRASGTTFSWEVPKNVLVDGEAYQAQFDTWDDESRVASSGDPRHTRTVVSFTVDDVPGVPTPTLVSVADYPAVDLAVTVSDPPDTFTFRRDGDVTDVKVDAADIYDATSGHYVFRQAAAVPLSAHEFQVRAVFDGQQSVWSNTITATVEPEGLWLVSIKHGLSVPLSGDGIDDWTVEDQVGVYDVQGRGQKVLIRNSLGALGGSFTGLLMATDSRSVKSLRADLRTMRKLNEPVRLIAADYSEDVRIWNVTDAPHPLSFKGALKRRVTFRFIESDS